MNRYALYADGVLVVHAGVIFFVVGGLIAILVGAAVGWRWVRNRWFRIAHLGAIGYVVLQAWLGMTCPLTDWENQLRRHAGQSGYGDQGFIAHWLHRLIFFDAEPWVFTLAYTLFGLAVVATFWWAPPRWGGGSRLPKRCSRRDPRT